MNKIFVQFHSLSLYRIDLYRNDFLSKRPVFGLNEPTRLTHGHCLKRTKKKFRSQSLKTYAKWQIEAVRDVADDLDHLNVRSLETINGFQSNVIKL